MSATSEEMVAAGGRVKVAPLATALTGAGTTVLGNAGVAAAAGTVATVPTEMVVIRSSATAISAWWVLGSSRSVGSMGRVLSASLWSAGDDVELRQVPAGEAHHRGGALEVG